MRTLLRMLMMAVFLLSWNIANSADWKYIGNSVLQGEKYYAFYDESTLVEKPNGNIVVWLKFIHHEILDTLSIDNDSTFTMLVAKKVASYYMPPYSIVDSDTAFNKYLDIVIMETMVNHKYLYARMSVLYEFDCKNRKDRTLSFIFYKPNGESESSSNQPTEWSYVAPDTFAETMIQVLTKGRHF